MAYYSLPLWNPVLSKAVLSMPWRHKGGAEVQLHLFLTLVTLPTGKNPHTLLIRGWVVPQPVWTFQRREKLHVSTGVQNTPLAACSIVTILAELSRLPFVLYRNTVTIKGDKKEYLSLMNQMGQAVHTAVNVLLSATSLSSFINRNCQAT